mmetsp:Transcript_8952/g.28326  ORF Transcript_8952/g.28326 Transcript_8952/m.28326 type:complete len:119 (-) Transcript_8952:1866-2222(-)
MMEAGAVATGLIEYVAQAIPVAESAIAMDQVLTFVFLCLAMCWSTAFVKRSYSRKQAAATEAVPAVLEETPTTEAAMAAPDPPEEIPTKSAVLVTPTPTPHPVDQFVMAVHRILGCGA